MILPFEMRKRSKPVATYALPVGELPNNGPVFVPLFVHLISTLSPFARISSCTSFRSGTAAILLQTHFFVPSGPLYRSSGSTGLCITKSGDRISSATSSLYL
jgi:hypothetical protein